MSQNQDGTVQVIANLNNYPIWLMQIQQSSEFNSPCSSMEFAAALIVYDDRVTDENRNRLSDALVKQGCRNAVCWGSDCSKWDDAIDWAFMATDPRCDPPEERFVMTSWYEDQPLEDALFNFLRSSAFDSFTPENFVVLIIGEGPYEEVIAATNAEIAGLSCDLS